MPLRIDSAGELLRVHETAGGALLFEGRSAKPGIYPYRRGDGTVVRELIDVDELHNPASLATAGRAPLTLEHPPEDVRADNWNEYAVGDLDGEVVCEPMEAGGFVRVRGAVRDSKAIKAFKKDAQELSWMYDADLDETPGTHPTFGPYDAIQRNRRYNSLALTTRGRHGSSVRARADSAVMDPPVSEPAKPEIETMDPRLVAILVAAGTAQPEAEAQLARADSHAMKMLGDAVQQLDRACADYQSQIDSMKQMRDEMAAEMETIKASKKADSAEIAALKAARSDAELIAFANERHPLITLAAAHKVDSANLGNDALREAIVKAAAPGAAVPAGLDARTYWRVRCDALTGDAPAAKSQGVFPTEIPAAKPHAAQRADDGLDAWSRSLLKSPATE